ncbi:DUF4232 domain-containing protein [Streptomyces paludis]|nr:DUF4232 domain-containing protein [Streptomyces paludis]
MLTSCGTQQANGGTSSTASPACGAEPIGDPSELKRDGVEITGVGGGAGACAQFEVTNEGTEPLTYTVTLTFLSPSGEALANPKETVRSVKPGAKVRRTVAASDLTADVTGGAARVRILQVRSVPTTEEPRTGGACPPSGVRLYADQGDAAMGLRVVGLRLENCGTRDYPLNGYPEVQLLGEDHAPVTGVRVLDGNAGIATGTGADAPPTPLTLTPGARAHATLVWRNTTEAGQDPVHAPYARIHAKPGTAPVTVTPEFDLGTTGKLGVGPWQLLDEGEGRARP